MATAQLTSVILVEVPLAPSSPTERPGSRSTYLWSVISWQITVVPTMVPFMSRIGEAVSETGNTVPSFRTRLVS